MASESSTSKSELSIKTKNIKSQKNRHINYQSWCMPRRTRAINSSGNVFIDLTSFSETNNCRNHKKIQKLKRGRVIQNKKRLEELSRPRQIVFESLDKPSPTVKVLQKQNRINKLSSSKRIAFHSSKQCSQISQVLTHISNQKPTLSNCKSNEKTSSVRTTSTQKWMERINKLAEPRIREPIPTNTIGKVPKKALLATASERIKELTKRKSSKSPVSHKNNRNPYKVTPQALKAICSPRTKLLATPKIFKIHSHHCKTGKVEL